MARAREIEIEPIARAYGGLELVVIGADDPEAMVRHSQECRERGYKFAADPSQQLARLDGPDVVSLMTGASVLLTNDYELDLLQSKTGWSNEQMLRAVGYRVTTLGSKGVEIVASDGSRLSVGALPEKAEDRPHRRGRRVPRRVPGGQRTRPVAGTLGAARFADGHPDPGNRRPAGVSTRR